MEGNLASPFWARRNAGLQIYTIIIDPKIRITSSLAILPSLHGTQNCLYIVPTRSCSAQNVCIYTSVTLDQPVRVQ